MRPAPTPRLAPLGDAAGTNIPFWHHWVMRPAPHPVLAPLGDEGGTNIPFWHHWVMRCLLLRPGVDQRERRARLVERYGGLRGSSDRIAALDEWELRTTADLLSSVPPPRPFPIG